MAIQSNFPAIRPSLDLNFTGSKTVDPRITFTRASTATYYDGKTVAKAEENLLLYSQEFDNVRWGKTGTTVTVNGAVAPDGTSTADTITATASTGVHRVGQSHASQYHIVSVFAKAGTHSFLQILGNQSLGFFANFDLTLGTVGTVGVGTNAATITSVGNGWYRCTAYFFSSPDNGKNFQLVSSASATYSESWTATGTESIYIWGAQLEQRDQATAYSPTTYQPITRYQPVLLTAPANTPRIDHDPITGESLGLLIEESRTNLLTYSEQFDNAAWTKSNSTIGSNVMVAPDGTLTADVLIPDTTTGGHRAVQTYTATQNTTYTFSCYVKSAGSPGFVLNSGGGAASAAFNLLTGSLTAAGGITDTSGVSGLITPVGNGWFRCSLTFTFVAPTVTTQVRIVVANSATNTQAEPGFTGDGYSGIYIWGAQLETEAFPTSYIKTEASQVTRAADNASMTGSNFSSWYRQDEGTMQVVFSAPNAESSLAKHVFAATTTGSITSRVGLLTVNNNSSAQFFVTTNNIVQCQLIAQSSYSGVFNVVGAYKENDFAAAGSGFSLSTDTSGTTPRVAEAIIGLNLNGHIKRLTYYPKRLSNQQLQALTL